MKYIVLGQTSSQQEKSKNSIKIAFLNFICEKNINFSNMGDHFTKFKRANILAIAIYIHYLYHYF